MSRLTSLANNLVGTAYNQTLRFGYTPAGQIASNTRSNAADYERATYENTAGGTRTLGTITAFRNRAVRSRGRQQQERPLTDLAAVAAAARNWRALHRRRLEAADEDVAATIEAHRRTGRVALPGLLRPRNVSRT